MNGRCLLRALLFTTLACLVTLVALGAMADPSDTSKAPTEDWVYDRGNIAILFQKTWTVGYNITVTNGSSLKILSCKWVLEPADGVSPLWIAVDNGSLEINGSQLSCAEGQPGFYIVANGSLVVDNSKLEGLVGNPHDGAGVSVRDGKADIQFSELRRVRQGDALRAVDSNVSLYDVKVTDVEGSGVVQLSGADTMDSNYTCRVHECDLYDIYGNGLVVLAHSNFGNAIIDCFKTSIHDVGDVGVVIQAGESSYSGVGNGSVLATFEQVEVYDIGDSGYHLSSLYQEMGGKDQNRFNVTLVNGRIENVSNSGIYCQMAFTFVYFDLVLEDMEVRDVALRSTSSRLSGVYYWYYNSLGGASFYAGNSTFSRCNPTGFESWEFGGIDSIRFHNCTFSDNIEGAIYTRLEDGQAPMIVDNCTIEDNGAFGIHTYAYRNMQCTPVTVLNSTFRGNGGPALHFSGGSSNRASNPGFNITACVIEDNDGLAVDIDQPYSGPGTIGLVMRDCLVDHTDGLRLAVGRDSSGVRLVVDISNTTISNSTLGGIMVVGRGSSSIVADISIMDVAVMGAGGEGIVVSLGRYGSYKPTLDCQVSLLNCTVTDVRGNAVALTVDDQGFSGERTFEFNGTSVRTAQRGFFTVGFDGDIWHGSVTDVLKEELYVIDGGVDVYHCEFSEITDRKLNTKGEGEIALFYDLGITVLWDTGAAAMGANVEIMDNSQTLISVVPVNRTDGSLPTYTMRPFVVKPTGVFSTSPYVIKVTFLEISKTLGIRLDRDRNVTIVLEDHVRPEVFILSPKQGHVQQSLTLDVRGSAWDSQSGVRTVLVSLDGDDWVEAREPWYNWNCTMEVDLGLIEVLGGVFNLRAKALDWADNERLSFVVVRIDPTPPALNVNFPPDGYVTNDPNLLVRGVTEVGSTIKINGEPAEVVVSMFIHTTTLVEGPNSITVVSIDPLGNVETVRLDVLLDTQPPYMLLATPHEGETVNRRELVVEALLEDGLLMTINGIPVVYGSDQYPQGAGYLEYPLNLTDGVNLIRFRAEDTAGNVISLERSVTLDLTPPWISIASPSRDQVLSRPEVTVKGTVELGVSLFVMDEAVTTTSGFFERTILAVEGANTIIVTAIDEAGNVAIEEVEIVVDTIEPGLAMTHPDEAISVATMSRYVMTGTVGLDGHGSPGAVAVLLDGLDSTSLLSDVGTWETLHITIAPDGTFTITVDLVEGRNDFLIEAVDAGGNIASEHRTIYLDSTAPALVVYLDPVVIDDETGLRSHALTLNLSGYTEPGSDLFILGIPVVVGPDGRFQMNVDLVPDGVTVITVTSTDQAGNVRTLVHEVSQTPRDDDGRGGVSGRVLFFVGGLVLFVLIAVLTARLVMSQRDQYIEVDAPGAGTSMVSEMQVEGDGGPRGRPRTPRVRRPRHPSAPTSVMTASGTEGVEESKELSDQGAEADIGPDETEQEVAE